MQTTALLQFFRDLAPVALIAGAWVAYLVWGMRWLRGVRHARPYN